MSTRPSNSPAWGWLVAGGAVSAGVFLLVFGQSGSCIDYVSPDAVSTCETGPVAGAAGTWAIGIAGALFLAFALYRAFRRNQ